LTGLKLPCVFVCLQTLKAQTHKAILNHVKAALIQWSDGSYQSQMQIKTHLRAVGIALRCFDRLKAALCVCRH